MAKKGKNKPNRQKKNEGRNEAPPKRTSARNKNKKHKNSNWKAGNDDPVRLAVEAGKCAIQKDGSKTNRSSSKHLMQTFRYIDGKMAQER